MTYFKFSKLSFENGTLLWKKVGIDDEIKYLKFTHPINNNLWVSPKCIFRFSKNSNMQKCCKKMFKTFYGFFNVNFWSNQKSNRKKSLQKCA